MMVERRQGIYTKETHITANYTVAGVGFLV